MIQVGASKCHLITWMPRTITFPGDPNKGNKGGFSRGPGSWFTLKSNSYIWLKCLFFEKREFFKGSAVRFSCLVFGASTWTSLCSDQIIHFSFKPRQKPLKTRFSGLAWFCFNANDDSLVFPSSSSCPSPSCSSQGREGHTFQRGAFRPNLSFVAMLA